MSSGLWLLDVLGELFFGKLYLSQNSLDESYRKVFCVNWHGHAKLTSTFMKQSGMVASLMMNIEARPLKSANNIRRSDSW